jgi:hypothetical protein
MDRQRPVTPPPMIAMGTDMGEDILGRVPAVDVIATATVGTQLKAEIDGACRIFVRTYSYTRPHIYQVVFVEKPSCLSSAQPHSSQLLLMSISNCPIGSHHIIILDGLI